MDDKRGRLSRWLVVGMMVAGLVVGPGLSSVVQAQSGEDIAKGLLRALIESQLEKSNRRDRPRPDPFRPPDGRPRETNEIRQLRPIEASFSQESATLSALLNTDARRSFDIRRHLPEVIRLQATATALKQQTDSQPDHRFLIDAYRGLNNDWKTLSHQLRQCQRLSPQSSAAIGRIDQLDQQYCALLGIQEQFDNQQLVRESYMLTAYIRDLGDELEHTPPPPGTTRRLPQNVRHLRQKAEYFSNLVAGNVQFQTVVNEYKALYDDWLGLQNDLRLYTDHSIARSVQRIQGSHRSIHQLLRLSIGIDRNLLLHLVHETDHALTELFRTVTLEQLLSLPDAEAIPSAADATYGTIQNLDDLVHRDQDPQALVEAWVYADEAWSLLAYYLEASKNPQTISQVRAIRQSMVSLRETLGVTVAYDREALVRSASAMENLAERLTREIRQWQTHPGSHDPALLVNASRLVSKCHDLEQALLTNRSQDYARRQCDEAIQLWQQIRPELKKCDTDERETFNHIVATLTPELIRMRTLLGE
jgi:hypothetical protein